MALSTLSQYWRVYTVWGFLFQISCIIYCPPRHLNTAHILLWCSFHILIISAWREPHDAFISFWFHHWYSHWRDVWHGHRSFYQLRQLVRRTRARTIISLYIISLSFISFIRLAPFRYSQYARLISHCRISLNYYDLLFYIFYFDIIELIDVIILILIDYFAYYLILFYISRRDVLILIKLKQYIIDLRDFVVSYNGNYHLQPRWAYFIVNMFHRRPVSASSVLDISLTFRLI